MQYSRYPILSRARHAVLALGIAFTSWSTVTSHAILELTDPLVQTAVKQVFGNATWDPGRLEFTRPGVIVSQATSVSPAGGFGLFAVTDATTKETYRLFASIMDNQGNVTRAPGAQGDHAIPHARFSYYHGIDINHREVFGMGAPTTPLQGSVEWHMGDIHFYRLDGDYSNPTGDQGLRSVPPNRYYPVEVSYRLADIGMNPVNGIKWEAPRAKVIRKVFQLDSVSKPQQVYFNLLDGFTRLVDYPIAIGAARRRWALDLNLNSFEGWLNPDPFDLVTQLAEHIAEHSEWKVAMDYVVD